MELTKRSNIIIIIIITCIRVLCWCVAPLGLCPLYTVLACVTFLFSMLLGGICQHVVWQSYALQCCDYLKQAQHSLILSISQHACLMVQIVLEYYYWFVRFFFFFLTCIFCCCFLFSVNVNTISLCYLTLLCFLVYFSQVTMSVRWMLQGPLWLVWGQCGPSQWLFP